MAGGSRPASRQPTAAATRGVPDEADQQVGHRDVAEARDPAMEGVSRSQPMTHTHRRVCRALLRTSPAHRRPR